MVVEAVVAEEEVVDEVVVEEEEDAGHRLVGVEEEAEAQAAKVAMQRLEIRTKTREVVEDEETHGINRTNWTVDATNKSKPPPNGADRWVGVLLLN
jgi:curli biogenesis system outer membrane secretion channel CsgG